MRGSHRVSIVSSAPEFVLVETFCNISWPYLVDTLHSWTGADAFEFASAIGPNPLLDTPERIDGGTVYPWNLFRSWQSGSERSVAVWKDNGRWNFRQNGEPQPFEDANHYSKAKKADRMNRTILFKYVKNLGIDPVRALIDRDLSKAVLFTTDHIGRNLDIYEEEFQRYVAYGEKMGLLD